MTKTSFKTNAKTCQRAIVFGGQDLESDILMQTNCVSVLLKVVICFDFFQLYTFVLQ